MVRDSSWTRERLLVAAERVFAEQGVDQASLVDIHRLAGQANKSALHYHFGSRELLVEAVVARHVERVAPSRRRMVAALRAQDSPPDIRALLMAFIQPLAEQMHTQEGRYGIRIASHLRARGGGYRRLGPGLPEGPEDLRWVYAELENRLHSLPVRVRIERIAAYSAMVTGTLADWATTAATEGPRAPFTSDEVVANLVDMGVAALTAPSGL